MITHLPSDIFRELLISLQLVSRPAPGAIWPAYISSMDDAPDDAAAVYDTYGSRDGRLMDTGEVISHPGIQVKTRSRDYKTGYLKANEIMLILAAIVNRTVVADNIEFVVQSVKRIGDIMFLGREKKNNRSRFTVNFEITVREKAPDTVLLDVGSGEFLLLSDGSFLEVDVS